jgi:hypothetical protein
VHFWDVEMTSATGAFSGLHGIRILPNFGPIAFSNTQMASLWSLAIASGNCSFDVTSMLQTIAPLRFLAQGNGVLHFPGSVDAYCVFSISATWGIEPFSAFVANFGAYAVGP